MGVPLVLLLSEMDMNRMIYRMGKLHGKASFYWLRTELGSLLLKSNWLLITCYFQLHITVYECNIVIFHCYKSAYLVVKITLSTNSWTNISYKATPISCLVSGPPPASNYNNCKFSPSLVLRLCSYHMPQKLYSS